MSPPKRCRILCAGIVVLDELFSVKDFPPPDGKVEASAYLTIGGGNAANAAITIARLGGDASYAGPIGRAETHALLRQPHHTDTGARGHPQKDLAIFSMQVAF
jgi:pfkB family carbohydrate kinase